ncbi:alpha/beta fold hydrolase [Rubellimicrobium rubrum]|uniref:Alpha/beta fold hydrolase n=1 Tax=Rubellimicrobium rubrum TaxID=2585369 RepID=A0A5C4MWU0_9RHOB|nr:alpha/beta hydrolase [Rubellimicrobium rubrum]TNC50536.1 alpha/beta fold hydrolase [Rubellimicrobium rubrum]
MPILAVRDSALPGTTDLPCVLARLPSRAPVVVMIHGFGFDPFDPQSDPHLHILGLDPDRRRWGAVSWPRRLDLAGDRGLGVAWGWPSTGTIWQANAQAAAQGKKLARFIGILRALDGQRPVHVIAHSLGARVAYSALTDLGPNDVQRVVLIAPALSLAEARAACRSPAGRMAMFVNVTGRENRLFDALLLAALPYRGRRLARRSICDDNWLDLALDDPDVLGTLRQWGWRIRPARVRICHWSGYLRPGVWRLYQDLLLRPDETPLSCLRTATSGPRGPKGLRSVSLQRLKALVRRGVPS